MQFETVRKFCSATSTIFHSSQLGKPDLGGTSQGFSQGVDGHHYTLAFDQLSKRVGLVKGSFQALPVQTLVSGVSTPAEGIG